MTFIELVRSRRSVRTFDGSALKPEDAESILNCADTAENPYAIPIEWRLLSAKKDGLSSPVIVGADTYIAGKLRPAPHAEEAFGYAFEEIVLFAASLGVGSTWMAGTLNRPAFERAMELREGEVMPCVSPLGYAAPKMSLRETVMRKGVKADSRLDFGKLFFDGSFDKPLTPESAGILAEPLEAVRWAPSAVNRQPWRVVLDGKAAHFYEKKNRGYVSPSGWDLQKIDLGIALCHFSRGTAEKGIRAEFVIDDPGLVAPQDTEYIASYVLKE